MTAQELSVILTPNISKKFEPIHPERERPMQVEKVKIGEF